MLMHLAKTKVMFGYGYGSISCRPGQVKISSAFKLGIWNEKLYGIIIITSAKVALMIV